MQNEALDIIDEELFQDNIDTDIVDGKIVWKDNFGAENEIESDQIAVNGDIIAWWQKNEVGKELVRIKIQEGFIINWRPPINTMGTNSMGCSFIEFYNEFLVLKYRDKHRERIFIINTKNIAAEEIKLKSYRKQMKLVDKELYIKEVEGGQIIKISIQSDEFTKEQIDENYLFSRGINFDV